MLKVHFSSIYTSQIFPGYNVSFFMREISGDSF